MENKFIPLTQEGVLKHYIYDIEVFKKDWLVVFLNVETQEQTVIVNDNEALYAFMVDREKIFCGFNNKFYDDWVVMTMLNGGDNDMVKEHNDWIIGGNKGWEFPFVQFKKKLFKSYDLRDDIADKGLSLKAIEGNLCQPIVESSIPFTIDRKLTESELEEVIYYCKWDVKNTFLLWEKRRGYLKSKIAVGKLIGMVESQSLSLTNPKLTARFLNAKVENKWTDEFEYTPPKELVLNRYTEPLEFFKEVNYEKTLQCKIAGVPHNYGWGGIHGAVENLFDKSDDEWLIVDIDVGSYYPSMMIQYDYISRNIPNAKGYVDVYNTRIEAKHRGDSETADSLKLVLNSTYGALKNEYNELYDPRQANHVCITGQLLLTDLIEKLEDKVPSFALLQSNTDGLMIKFKRTEEHEVDKVVLEWQKRTRMTMEYKVIHKIFQKDVNNYVLTEGASYLVSDDFSKTILKEDKNKVSTKGGWASLWQGGSFKNNSLSIVHKALVLYFTEGKPVEDTVNEETDIFAFQIICKTGSTYDGANWSVNNEMIPVNKVNRVYAVKDSKYGKVYKMKGESATKIADLPEHCFIDNECKFKIENVDKDFYIQLALARIAEFKDKGVKKLKNKKEVKKMAVAKTEDFSKLNVYQKLIRARYDFCNSNIKKSGVNRFSKFKYFELADIVPVANEVFLKYGLIFTFNLFGNVAVGHVINCDKPNEEQISFELPYSQLDVISDEGKKKMNEMQAVGAMVTYLRRYVYMMALDITENDYIDYNNGGNDTSGDKQEDKKPTTPASTEERKEMVEKLTDGNTPITEVQKKSIKAGLAKIRDLDGDEDFIANCVSKVKGGMNSEQAEELLLEISAKVGELSK